MYILTIHTHLYTKLSKSCCYGMCLLFFFFKQILHECKGHVTFTLTLSFNFSLIQISVLYFHNDNDNEKDFIKHKDSL